MYQLDVAEMDSPVGGLSVGAVDGEVVLIAFASDRDRVVARLERHLGPLEAVPAADPGGAVSALEGYFSGDLGAIDELPVRHVGTRFQREVWAALRAVPVGETTSYRAVATAIGSPGAVRAVGSANGANPVVVVVPCHRVVRSDGALGGYGGGLDRKRWLLAHEASPPAPPALDGAVRVGGSSR